MSPLIPVMLPLEIWLGFGERALRVETVAVAQELSGQDCGSTFAAHSVSKRAG
jgi:hypothetical protein